MAEKKKEPVVIRAEPAEVKAESGNEEKKTPVVVKAEPAETEVDSG